MLHYVFNDAPLRDGDLLLIDAGCELDGYASDITRTFPVNGRFSAAQREVYEVVLAAQRAAIDAVRPGKRLERAARRRGAVLAQGMIDLKLLAGSLDEVLEKETYKRFYMHRTGHWLGLDVHDAGDYKRAGQLARAGARHDAHRRARASTSAPKTTSRSGCATSASASRTTCW